MLCCTHSHFIGWLFAGPLSLPNRIFLCLFFGNPGVLLLGGGVGKGWWVDDGVRGVVGGGVGGEVMVVGGGGGWGCVLVECCAGRVWGGWVSQTWGGRGGGLRVMMVSGPMS